MFTIKKEGGKNMQKVLIIYAIIQLMTTAYGLAVIESIRPMVEARLRGQGYIKNKNSLYTCSNTLKDIALGFIPFYYLGKAISILNDKKSVDKKVNEVIKSGKYITEEELKKKEEVVEEDTTDSIYKSPYDYAFEKPEKYTARKNDITQLYDTYESPIDYIERVSKKEDNLELTPFTDVDRVVEHVVVKPDVTKADIARAVSELSSNELDSLKDKIVELSQIKKAKEKMLKLEKVDKDVA
jgi:hypothetical protein